LEEDLNPEMNARGRGCHKLNNKQNINPEASNNNKKALNKTYWDIVFEHE
jgi:hypothetical protein